MESKNRKNVKYCVVLRKGEKDEKRQEFYVLKEAMENALKPYTFAGGTPGTKHVIDMIHVVFKGNPKDIKDYVKDCIKKGKTLARAEFIEGEFNSLELEVNTEEDAIKCLKCLKLR